MGGGAGGINSTRIWAVCGGTMDILGAGLGDGEGGGFGIAICLSTYGRLSADAFAGKATAITRVSSQILREMNRHM